MVKTYQDIIDGIVGCAIRFDAKYGAGNWNTKEVVEDESLKFFQRLLKIYQRYEERSKAYGYIGVGCITYAEYYLRRFQMKVNKAV